MGRILIVFILSGLLAFPTFSQTDKEIKDWYGEYNTMFFRGKLPKNIIIQRSTDPDFLARTTKIGDKFVITFSDSYKLGEILTELILLHEMCHVETWDEAVIGRHGPKWRVCMLKLKMQGAFDELIIEAY